MKYIIKNNQIQIEVSSLGAELKSLKAINDDIKLEYLWQGDKKYWNRSSPVLFPIVGKLLDDEYFYKDKSYSMSQHGFARDKEFKIVEQTNNFLKLMHKSDLETLEVYPFEYELYISYEIIEREVKVSYEVINKSKENMFFSIGAHPAFNWPLENESKEDYYFEFISSLKTDNLDSFPLLQNGISNKKLNIKLEKNQLNISNHTFKNDALIFKNENINSIKLKNTINDKFIKVDFDSFTYLGLWSKPTGAPFVCIEPWYGIADFIDHNKNIEEKEGINILEFNEVFLSTYSIKV